MKHIIDSDDYEIVVKNLKQVQSLALIFCRNSAQDEDNRNVFWIIQDLINHARHIVEDAETV